MFASDTGSRVLSTPVRAISRTRCDVRRTTVCAAALLAVALGVPAAALADEPAAAAVAPFAPSAPGANVPVSPAVAPSAPGPGTVPPPPPPYAYAPPYWYGNPYAPPGAPVLHYPPPVDPVAAAYMAEHDAREVREHAKKGKLKLPGSVTWTPEYEAARGKKIGGILGLTLGGGSLVGGLVWLISASLRGWGLFHSNLRPDHAGQAGGGALMIGGAISMVVGGGYLSLGKKEMKKIEDEYYRQVVPGFSVDVGVGSVMVSTSF